jgi:putative salt-induced outer membrane protein YdiY
MRCPVLCLVIAIQCAGIAAADEVRLADGSVVRGRVVSVSGGKLKIATDFAGELTIAMNKVTAVVTDGPREIRIGLTHDVQGALGLDEGTQVLHVGAAVQPLDLGALTVVQDLGVPIVDPPRANWTGRAELGVTGKSGNTDRIDARALVTTTRTGPKGRLILTLRGAYAQSDGVRSQSEVMGTEIYERDVTKRLFVYEKLELEYDEFENLDLRGTIAGGLGYFLVRSPRQELKFRSGLAYQREQFTDGTSDDNLLAEAGYDYRLDISKWLRYTSRFTYFVVPGDWDDWRFDAENAAEIPLSQKSGWKLKLGVRNEYDAMPQPGIERLDTSYYASLVYNWD